MDLCHAQGTLVVPVWKSSFFWNSCTSDGVHWSDFVIDWVYLPKFQGLFVNGKARSSLFGSKLLDFDVAALRIDFRRPRPPLLSLGFARSLLGSVTPVGNMDIQQVFCSLLSTAYCPSIFRLFSFARLFSILSLFTNKVIFSCLSSVYFHCLIYAILLTASCLSLDVFRSDFWLSQDVPHVSATQ